MTCDVAFDLETTGTVAGSAIVSIGAVRFNDEGLLLRQHPGGTADEAAMNRLRYEFYVEIDLVSCGQAGLQSNNETLAWWLEQSDHTRKALVHALSGKATRLQTALTQFAAWMSTGDKVDTVWCHGAAFDFPIIEHAMQRVQVETPWKYWQLRCARTLGESVPVTRPRHDRAHNALADAAGCAEHVVQCRTWIRGAKEAALARMYGTGEAGETGEAAC